MSPNVGVPTASAAPAGPLVRDFRQILLWPLQLKRLSRHEPRRYWQVLADTPGPWKEAHDHLQLERNVPDRAYAEFVYFLPYVQRFLFGFGDASKRGRSSLFVFQRRDITTVELQARADLPVIQFRVGAVRLYFFQDVDIALLTMEVAAHDVPLEATVEAIDRFGRPYPPSWNDAGHGEHAPHCVRFLDADGKVLATSDYHERDRYTQLVKNIKQTPLSSHWEFLLKPLTPSYAGGGPIECYLLENKRIPVMTHCALDDPKALSVGDMVRLGCAAKWGESNALPYSRSFLADFEEKHCYDRHWDPHEPEMNTRYMFYGLAFTMLTKHGERPELTGYFRHQFFLIALIAHFHKAALLNLSNRFSWAVERLNEFDYDSARQFRATAREILETFLRFDHRYWFREISNQVQAADFFQHFRRELGTDQLFDDVRAESQDINLYLDSERARKQADNAMRLTVVSACGMVGTIVTGFLGMNLFSHADLSVWAKVVIFMIVFIPTTLISLWTVVLSKRIANFMEALSSEDRTWREKVIIATKIFRLPKHKAKVATSKL